MKDKLIKTGEKYYRWIMLAIIGIQAFLLVATLIRFGVEDVYDTYTYTEPAENLLRTGILMNADGSPILFRTPGYCVFLAVVYFFTNHSNVAVVLLQFLMVLATDYMIYYMVSKISGKKILGCVASLFYICDAAVYNNAVCILTDTVMPFLLMLALVLFYNYYKKQKVIWFFWCAVVLNYAMTVRPQLMYYNMILVGVCLVLALLRKLGWRECVIYIAIFALVYGGWSFRNYKWYGEAIFSSVALENSYNCYIPLVYALDEGDSEDDERAYFKAQLYEEYPDFDELSKIEQIHAKEDIAKSYLGSHFGAFLKLNIMGLFNEMRDPCSAIMKKWNLPQFIFVILWCFVSGMLILSYCIYAVGFLKNFNRQTWFDWLILLTVMYLMASTAVIGFSRFRLAFYPLCLVGTFTCYKKSRKRLVRECVDDNDDLKGVICDLDGTLYRQKPVRLHMFFALLGHYVAHIDKLQQLYGIYLFRKIREREDFRQTSYSSQIEYVSEKVKLGKEELDNVIQYWMFEYPLRWVGRYADNYLISKLKEVQDRGVKVIIYSDYPADDKLEVLGIKPDYVFYPGISGIDSLKPSKEAMDLIVREVGIASGELVYIGDRQEKDGVSAQLVGISFALV